MGLKSLINRMARDWMQTIKITLRKKPQARGASDSCTMSLNVPVSNVVLRIRTKSRLEGADSREEEGQEKQWKL